MGLEVVREQTPGPRGYANSHFVSLSRAFLTDEDGIRRSTMRVLEQPEPVMTVLPNSFSVKGWDVGKKIIH